MSSRSLSSRGIIGCHLRCGVIPLVADVVSTRLLEHPREIVDHDEARFVGVVNAKVGRGVIRMQMEVFGKGSAMVTDVDNASISSSTILRVSREA